MLENLFIGKDGNLKIIFKYLDNFKILKVFAFKVKFESFLKILKTFQNFSSLS